MGQRTKVQICVKICDFLSLSPPSTRYGISQLCLAHLILSKRSSPQTHHDQHPDGEADPLPQPLRPLQLSLVCTLVDHMEGVVRLRHYMDQNGVVWGRCPADPGCCQRYSYHLIQPRQGEDHRPHLPAFQG